MAKPKQQQQVINTSDRRSFNQVVRQVQQIALPLMDKKARKDYLDAKIRALGGKLAKQQKCPLPMLLKIRQRRQDEMKEAKELEKITGVKLHTTSADNYKCIVAGKKKRELQKLKRKNEPRLF